MDSNAARCLTARLTQQILGGLFAAIFCVAATAHAQTASAQSSSSSPSGPVAHGTIATADPVTYDNKYEIYGGLSYMSFKAGPYLAKSMNNGGGEVMGTYWLGPVGRFAGPGRLGLAADYRFEAGTTQVDVNHVNLNRTLVFQNIAMGGVQMRGPKNQFFALDLHALAGASKGNFSHGTLPAAPPEAVGLYTDRTAFIGALGFSVDVNESKHWAIRFSPDLMFSHYGTYMATSIALSGGLVYRFGK